MKQPFTLQCLVFGAILGNPKRLESVDPDDFGDTELAGVVALLKQGDTSGLTQWLAERDVKWEKSEKGGSSIDAVQTKAKKLAQIERAKRAANQAKFLCYADAEELKSALQKVIDSIR